MTRSEFTSILVITIVVFVSQTLAKPQSELDHHEKNQAEYSENPGTGLDYIEDRGPGSLPPNASASFQGKISRSRRSEIFSNIYQYEDVTTPGINALYRLYLEAKTWVEARKNCQEKDGHLVIINSIAESQIIANFIERNFVANPYRGSTDSNYVIIGFYRPLPKLNVYRTIDGRTVEEAGFAEWGQGEPIYTRQCGAVTRDGKLSTVSCDDKYTFICEIPRHDNVPPAGPAGPVGPQGVPGVAGLKGEKGNPGEAGASGNPGPAGPRGQKGVSGLHGQKGERGEGGTDGLQGVAGEKGSKGDTGLGYDAVCSAVLSVLEQIQGPGLIDGGKARIFSEDDTILEECQEFMTKTYGQDRAAGSSQNFARRDGRKELPAKTCKDLFFAYPDKPSGEYWIDPNGDDIGDAILVRCDVERSETCVSPELPRTPIISYSGYEREVWFSEIDYQLQIKYTAATSQIIALQALSSNAQQKVTYHCIKSVGYFDTENQTNERGLKLLAWNDVELEPRGSRQFRYDVISDGCRDRLDEWKETVIAYRTDKPARLPVTDVYLRDVRKPGQSFAVEIGEVCFG